MDRIPRNKPMHILIHKAVVLPRPSSLCLPHDGPMNWRRGGEAKEYDFIRKASRLRRRQTSVSEKPSYLGLDASFFYRIREGDALRK